MQCEWNIWSNKILSGTQQCHCRVSLQCIRDYLCMSSGTDGVEWPSNMNTHAEPWDSQWKRGRWSWAVTHIVRRHFTMYLQLYLESIIFLKSFFTVLISLSCWKEWKTCYFHTLILLFINHFGEILKVHMNYAVEVLREELGKKILRQCVKM